MVIKQTINDKSSSQPTQQITTETVTQTLELNNDIQVENSENTSTDMLVSKIECKENSVFSTITGDSCSKMDYSKDLIKRLLSSYIKEKIYPKMKFLPNDIKVTEVICRSSIFPKGNIVLPDGMKKDNFVFLFLENTQDFYKISKNI